MFGALLGAGGGGLNTSISSSADSGIENVSGKYSFDNSVNIGGSGKGVSRELTGQAPINNMPIYVIGGIVVLVGLILIFKK